MTVRTAAESLDALQPIGLDELNAVAALQTRVDRKYVMPVSRIAPLLAEVDDDTRVLKINGTRAFGYESVYFDTERFESYFLAMRGRRRRYKIRTRTYLESNLCFLEVKTRGGRGHTVKDRIPYQPKDFAKLAPGNWFVEETLREADLRRPTEDVLFPRLMTRYRRATLYLPSSHSRATIDTNLQWYSSDGEYFTTPGLAIVETKTGARPSPLDHLLWAQRTRPEKISKYATGMAMMYPRLPSNPWHRTLRRHFADVEQETKRFEDATPMRMSV